MSISCDLFNEEFLDGSSNQKEPKCYLIGDSNIK